MKRMLLAASLVILVTATSQAQNKRDMQVRADKRKLADHEKWIYNDFDRAAAAAKAAKKPMLVVFR